VKVAVDSADIMELTKCLREGKADLAQLQWAGIVAQPLDAIERTPAFEGCKRGAPEESLAATDCENGNRDGNPSLPKRDPDGEFAENAIRRQGSVSKPRPKYASVLARTNSNRLVWLMPFENPVGASAAGNSSGGANRFFVASEFRQAFDLQALREGVGNPESKAASLQQGSLPRGWSGHAAIRLRSRAAR
jgi:hypothetical protein